MTAGKQPSRSLGYKILYNVDRTAAFDLCDAFTPEDIGRFMNNDLMDKQHLQAGDLAEAMKDYTDADGRFFCYAQLHGWTDLIAEAQQCFDISSEENRERLGAYDLRTALYRFVAILGVTPTYRLSDGTLLSDGHHLDSRRYQELKDEIRNGAFAQWLTVFYHEDPSQDFSETYSYERALESWLKALGAIDSQQVYYRRYMKACEDAKERIVATSRQWKRAHYTERLWKFVFIAFAVVWIALVLVMGIDDRTYLLDHYFLTMVMPLGAMTGIIVATRAYFKGYGSFVSLLFGGLGFSSAYIPYYILKYVETGHPGLFHYVVAALTVVYVVIALLTDFSKERQTDPQFIHDVLNSKDERSTLLDPLYYTFKTKSQRYKASNFGLLDEVADQSTSMSGETVIHYVLWTLTVIVLIAELCLFSPQIIGWPSGQQTTEETITIQE